MEIGHPILFVEINDTNYIFVAGRYDESQNFQVIQKQIVPSSGIIKNKFVNIQEACEEVKKNIALIEKNLNYIFKETIVISTVGLAVAWSHCVNHSSRPNGMVYGKKWVSECALCKPCSISGPFVPGIFYFCACA